MSDITLPRHVKQVNTTDYTVDTNKIILLQGLSDQTKKAIIEGKLISNSLYPLIYDSKCNTPSIDVRSIQFYKEAIENPEIYKNLDAELKAYFHLGIRDLFYAANEGILQDVELVKAVIELIDIDDENGSHISIAPNSYKLTPYPTRQNIAMRFISYKIEDEFVDKFFIKKGQYKIAFVDPTDLSFHNFENIIDLDVLFRKKDFEFKITNFNKVDNEGIFTFNLVGNDNIKTLTDIDGLGFYSSLGNSAQRGGKRLIFNSEELSKQLSTAVRQLNCPELLNNFEFVNYIFRYNKFSPNDKKFSNHYDSPFHDRTKKLVSKYTVIFYLTGGKGDPVLSIEDKFKLDHVDIGQGIYGIIFDQKYQHEGKAYLDNDKIFLRTEIIHSYAKGDIENYPGVAETFNIACYMAKQSIFNKELDNYVCELFNKVAITRLNMSKNLPEYYFLHKCFKEINFITNGNDYFFCNNVTQQAAAIIILMDYFNAIKDGLNFNKLCKTDIFVFKNEDNNEEVYKKILDGMMHVLVDLNKANASITIHTDNFLFENNNFRKLGTFSTDSTYCCGSHYTTDFIPLRCSSVATGLRDKNKETLKELEKYSVMIFDAEVKLDPCGIEVKDDHILINGEIPTIHFAGDYEDSCWNYDNSTQYIYSNPVTVEGYQHLPPIHYLVKDKVTHYRIDLFNSNFMRKDEKQTTFWGAKANRGRSDQNN
jgi:hypothetical protein